MSDLALRQRSSTELVDATFQVYRKDPLPFILAGAVVYVPWLLVRLLFGFGLDPNGDMREVFAGTAGLLLVYSIASGVAALLTRDVYFDRPADFMSAVKATVPRIGTLVVASIATYILFVFSLIALILPFFYMIARLFAMREAIMLEGKSVNAAFARTSELSRGVKGHVLLTLFLVAVLSIAVNMGGGFLTLVIPSLVAKNVLTTVITTLVFPLFAITETLLYYDVRIRKEGFDVEYLATQDPGAAPAPAPAQ